MSLRPTIKISATIIVQFHGCEIYRLETQSYHRQKMYNWMLKYNFDVYARAIRTFQPGLHIWSPTILKANMSVVLHTIKNDCFTAPRSFQILAYFNTNSDGDGLLPWTKFILLIEESTLLQRTYCFLLVR